ncbi:hypothetical protein AAG747_28140 [Rapidithrix thailandica]|uniref:Uncharacterized protein n=1 Tax=Rapidithrix thailandica TaxID=413964 RepID=A0AAW9S3R0_9BACT
MYDIQYFIFYKATSFVAGYTLANTQNTNRAVIAFTDRSKGLAVLIL